MRALKIHTVSLEDLTGFENLGLIKNQCSHLYKLISLIFVQRKRPVTGKSQKILAYKKSL